MKEIVVRKAREDDFQAIIEISKGIYQGHDYFLCVFHDWLQTLHRLIFVAEFDGKVVGLRAINIVDNGKTFISQGLRIHPDFRGQGLSSRLIDAVHDFIRTHYPNVFRERFTTKSDNIERLAIQKKNGDRAVLDQDILAFHADKDEVSPELLEEMRMEIAAIRLYPYAKRDISDIIFTEEVANVLFQERTLIIDWEPYEALRTNIDYVFQETDSQFADRSPADYSRGELPKSFSHGRRSPRTDCMHWVTTIYTDDPLLYQAHLLKQFKCAISSIKGPFIFSPFQQSSLTNTGREVLDEKLHLKPVEFFTFGLRLFEKEFK